MREHKLHALLDIGEIYRDQAHHSGILTVAGIDSVLQFEGCRLNRLDELVAFVNDFHEQAITIRRRDPR